MRSLLIVLLATFAGATLMVCGEDSNGVGDGWNTVEADGAASDHVDQSLLTPEGDGTFSMADNPTPVPSSTPISEPIATLAPTATPEPTFDEIYWDDVVAALHGFYAARHTRSQSAMDSVTTAATTDGEYNTVEYMKSASSMGRGWSDYPDIDIVEITHLKCDEVLCKIWFDAISNPPSDSRDAPFEIEDYKYFRLVSGVWLEDHTHETWDEEWESTHRE